MRFHHPVVATILVVEDDALINMAAVNAIEDQGYLVLSAANADEALMVLTVHPEIDLLFTDIKMPGSIDGLALAGVARHDCPRLEIVIASGTVRPNPDQMPARAKFLPKPYSAKQVADTLHGLIDGPTSLAS